MNCHYSVVLPSITNKFSFNTSYKVSVINHNNVPLDISNTYKVFKLWPFRSPHVFNLNRVLNQNSSKYFLNYSKTCKKDKRNAVFSKESSDKLLPREEIHFPPFLKTEETKSKWYNFQDCNSSNSSYTYTHTELTSFSYCVLVSVSKVNQNTILKT